ncbi:MAG: type I restriction enzyme HsdR N-terminal domain-containing protein [Bacteroidetes bacterium]|nr:type I restriction enzyme HsdR N-terminal domain-containing protein [Bacteroidota bacterium]
MEFQNKLKVLADRVANLKENIQTEEATKNAFIMPFIQILGYDVFNPMEVIPEFTADIGKRKGEKVDYAILQDNKPIILIECKHWKENLDGHSSQLQRYFNVTKASFGLLTNGLKYRFYSDLENQNIMDEEPFLVFDIENIKENVSTELKKFQKESFDIDKIMDSASGLKYSTAIKKILIQELAEPSEKFVRFFIKEIDSSKIITKKVIEQSTEIVKKATNQAFKDIVNDRLKSALNKEEETVVEEDAIEEECKIFTTEEEIEAYQIVRSIVRTKVNINRIVGRDTQSYFGILLDDNNRKPICRLHLNGSKKYIGIFDQNKKEEKFILYNLDEIFLHSEKLLETVLMYD